MITLTEALEQLGKTEEAAVNMSLDDANLLLNRQLVRFESAANADKSDDDYIKKLRQILQDIKNGHLLVITPSIRANLADCLALGGSNNNEVDELINCLQACMRLRAAIADKELSVKAQLENESKMQELIGMSKKLDAESLIKLKSLFNRPNVTAKELEQGGAFKLADGVFAFYDNGKFTVHIASCSKKSIRQALGMFATGAHLIIPDWSSLKTKEKQVFMQIAAEMRLEITDSEVYKLGFRNNNTPEENYDNFLKLKANPQDAIGRPEWLTDKIIESSLASVMTPKVGGKPQESRLFQPSAQERFRKERKKALMQSANERVEQRLINVEAGNSFNLPGERLNQAKIDFEKIRQIMKDERVNFQTAMQKYLNPELFVSNPEKRKQRAQGVMIYTSALALTYANGLANDERETLVSDIYQTFQQYNIITNKQLDDFKKDTAIFKAAPVTKMQRQLDRENSLMLSLEHNINKIKDRPEFAHDRAKYRLLCGKGVYLTEENGTIAIDLERLRQELSSDAESSNADAAEFHFQPVEWEELCSCWDKIKPQLQDDDQAANELRDVIKPLEGEAKQKVIKLSDLLKLQNVVQDSKLNSGEATQFRQLLQSLLNSQEFINQTFDKIYSDEAQAKQVIINNIKEEAKISLKPDEIARLVSDMQGIKAILQTGTPEEQTENADRVNSLDSLLNKLRDQETHKPLENVELTLTEVEEYNTLVKSVKELFTRAQDNVLLEVATHESVENKDGQFLVNAIRNLKENKDAITFDAQPAQQVPASQH